MRTSAVQAAALKAFVWCCPAPVAVAAAGAAAAGAGGGKGDSGGIAQWQWLRTQLSRMRLSVGTVRELLYERKTQQKVGALEKEAHDLMGAERFQEAAAVITKRVSLAAQKASQLKMT